MNNLLQRQTILVVDDIPENIDILSAILREHYHVRAALSGEKALRLIYSDEPPDLVLLDIMMPGLSGLELCRRIKANPDRRKIPIIFVTAMCSVEDERIGLETGAVDYITKPVSPPVVLARVRTHLALYDQTREMERMVMQRTRELGMSRQQVICRLGRAAEYRDDETGNHILRVAHYARLIAEAYGLGPKAVRIIFSSAPMHDIGKIGIRDAVLLKPGRLDEDELRDMRLHAAIGAEIIGQHDSELLETAHSIALTHHERWNGTGYPVGLQGEDIPLEGRIVAIADVFDALTSARTYKKAFSLEESLAIMDSEDGRHFDPTLMLAFRKALPAILKVREEYADDKGVLADLGLSQEWLPADE
jgi:putative two-component system response regulator